MPLAAGTRFGPYEIFALIGAGGMGEVYRARDTKLGRDVALKVLPESFSRDPERMARFEREAHVLASLNHPNIATVYGFEAGAIGMELVEGPTLAERIGGRPMQLDEALPIAKQIAEGLEYAHEKGVVHRDLKPANVKLTADGNVRILDFGLAKALESPVPVGNPSISPTLVLSATQAGVILGTAAYMAPEQVMRNETSPRSDLFSLGVMLHEMIAGERPFAGESEFATMQSVIREAPARVGQLRADTIRLGPVLRLARRDARRDEALDLSIADALRHSRCLTLESQVTARDVDELRLAEPRPFVHRNAQQTQDVRQRTQLRAERRHPHRIAAVTRGIHLAQDVLQHRQRLGSVEVIVHALQKARAVGARGELGRGNSPQCQIHAV